LTLTIIIMIYWLGFILQEKNAELVKENQSLTLELTKLRDGEDKLLLYVRELEQKNDDVERCHRIMMETIDNIQVELNSQIEKNALLETELDEKDALQVMVQRLKDEQRGRYISYSLIISTKGNGTIQFNLCLMILSLIKEPI